MGKKRVQRGGGSKSNLAYFSRGVKALQKLWHPHTERLMKLMEKRLVCFAVKEVI